MTFGSTFGRVFSPTFQPKSQAAVAGGTWWDLNGTITSCVAAYQPKGAASLAASYVNLANPGTYDAAEGVAPIFSSATGWQFSGSEYLKTGVVPADGYSVILMYSDVSSPDGAASLISALKSSPACYFEINPKYTSNTIRFLYGDKTLSVSGQKLSGVVAMTQNEAYYEGSSIGSIPDYTWNGLPYDAYIGARNYQVGDPNNFIAGKISAIAIYNAPIDDYISDLTTAMKAIEPGIDPLYFDEDFVAGTWSWFTKPTYVYKNSKSYFTTIDTQNSDLNIHCYDSSTDTLTSSTLSSSFGADDHNLASILFRDNDGKILAFGAKHNDSDITLWISTNAGDVSSWGSGISLDSSLGKNGYSYPCPIQLTGETNDPIYLFYRTMDGDNFDGQCFSKSEDGGSTWSTGTKFFSNGTERPYFQYARNGTDRIDFACTQGHPHSVSGCSIYHFYYTGGKWYKSDGTEITDSLPIEPSDVTQVYDGSTTEAWVWDIAINSSGNPVIAFATFPTPDSDHRYNYAVWTGSAWSVHEICTAGKPLYPAQTYYSGGVTIDKGDPNIVWCSRVYNGKYEIFKYVTSDGGANWSETQYTSNSIYTNARPICADGSNGLVPLFWEGIYISYDNTDCYVKFR